MKDYKTFNPAVSEEQEGNYIALDIKATDEETVEIESSTGKGAKTLEPGDRFLVWRVKDTGATMRVSVTGGEEDKETTYKASGLTLETKDAATMPVSAPNLGPAPFSMPAPADCRAVGVPGVYTTLPQEGLPVEVAEDGGNDLSAGFLPGLAETLDVVDGHFTKESLMGMTRANLEKLAEDLGVNVSKCKNKTEIATLLAAIEVGEPPEADTEAPPDLGAEAPVV